MRPILLTMLALVLSPFASQQQTLSSSFSFTREANKAGTTDYVLKPMIDEIHKKIGGADKPYQVLGAVARPTTDGAVLVFANAQTESQLYSQTNRGVSIKAGSLEVKNLEYELAAQSEDNAPTKLEIANVLITFKDFQKIAGAKSVTVKFGSVAYQLDKDNLDALHYMAAEIEKDQNKTN